MTSIRSFLKSPEKIISNESLIWAPTTLNPTANSERIKNDIPSFNRRRACARVASRYSCAHVGHAIRSCGLFFVFIFEINLLFLQYTSVITRSLWCHRRNVHTRTAAKTHVPSRARTTTTHAPFSLMMFAALLYKTCTAVRLRRYCAVATAYPCCCDVSSERRGRLAGKKTWKWHKKHAIERKKIPQIR